MENKKIINATKVRVGEIEYRSKLERSVAKYLEDNNIPFEYEKHKLELIPTQRYNGQTLRSVHYTPDFICGNFIIEAKGFPNDSWSLKKKVIIQNIIEGKLPYEFREVHSIRELKDVINEMNGNKEEWRPVVGFEKLYEVSNMGNVRSIQFHGKKRIRLLSIIKDNRVGYLSVKLRDWENATEGNYLIHRLVAQAFIPNPDNKPQVDHIDTNPSNNKVSNLQWVTPLENQNNPITLDRLRDNLISYNKSQKHKRDIQLSQGHPVIQYSRDMKFIAEFISINDAANSLNTTACCIKRVCDGDRKFHRNFIFRYKDESHRKNEEIAQQFTQE